MPQHAIHGTVVYSWATAGLGYGVRPSIGRSEYCHFACRSPGFTPCHQWNESWSSVHRAPGSCVVVWRIFWRSL